MKLKRITSLIQVFTLLCALLISAPRTTYAEEVIFERAITNVPYVENPTDYQYMDIQLPNKGEGPFPVVVFIHGGAWVGFDRTYDLYNQTFNYLMKNGYAIVRIDYTLSQGSVNFEESEIEKSGYPQMIYDVKAAVRYLKANAEEYHLDSDHIALLGESAGAHLAMLAGATNGNSKYEDMAMGNAEYTSDVQAVVSFYGPTDLSLNPLLAECVLGYDYTEEQMQEASPYYQVTENMVPLLLNHGENDAQVSIEHSYKIEARVKELCGEDRVTTMYHENAVHGDAKVYNSKLTVDALTAFLDTNLKGITSQPATPTEKALEPTSAAVTTQPTQVPQSVETTQPTVEAEKGQGLSPIIPIAIILVVCCILCIVLIRQKRKR